MIGTVQPACLKRQAWGKTTTAEEEDPVTSSQRIPPTRPKGRRNRARRAQSPCNWPLLACGAVLFGRGAAGGRARWQRPGRRGDALAGDAPATRMPIPQRGRWSEFHSVMMVA